MSTALIIFSATAGFVGLGFIGIGSGWLRRQIDRVQTRRRRRKAWPRVQAKRRDLDALGIGPASRPNRPRRPF